MKALLFTGVKEPLVYTDVNLPEYDDTFGVVQLNAAALNRRDYWITLGLYPNLRFPSVLGSDGCGVYEGEEVVINPSIHWGNDPRFYSDDYYILGMEEYGTFAEQVAVRKKNIYPKPAHLTAEQAAALPLAGLTAYRVLFSRCQAKAGEKVLISGVGGGVALLACQFAIAIGADVYVTSGSEEKIEKAIALGAKGGMNYKDPDAMKILQKAIGGFDVVIDSAGNVIDYGRRRRLFTGAARDAVMLHSPRCTWSGCDTTSSYCNADHTIDWQHGGPTTTTNGGPLCPRHDRTKNRGYKLRRDPNGTWHTYRPDGTAA